jgi:hypothetical protein
VYLSKVNDRAPGPPESSPPEPPLEPLPSGLRRGLAIGWMLAVVALYLAVRVFDLQLVR